MTYERTTLTSLLLGATMLAGPATGATVCEGLTDATERFCSISHLSSRTQASCDAFERSAAALCSRFTIYASMDAEGPTLDLLRQDYEIRDIV
jgi:hypothetical protein